MNNIIVLVLSSAVMTAPVVGLRLGLSDRYGYRESPIWREYWHNASSRFSSFFSGVRNLICKVDTMKERCARHLHLAERLNAASLDLAASCAAPFSFFNCGSTHWSESRRTRKTSWTSHHGFSLSRCFY